MVRCFAWLTTGLALATACGGIVVVDPDGVGGAPGGGGSGGEGDGATPSSSTTSSTSTGGGGCASHEQCHDEQVCLFGTGQCAHRCQDACDACGPGFICDGCATSSCATCGDCVAACRSIGDGECDDDDSCLDGSKACAFETGQCMTACQPDDTCPDDGEICEPCATSSCCGCKDCVPLCVPI